MAVETVRVGLEERAYDILIGSGVRERAAELAYGRLLTVTDSEVDERYGEWIDTVIGADSKFIFPAGEASKIPVTVIRHLPGMPRWRNTTAKAVLSRSAAVLSAI